MGRKVKDISLQLMRRVNDSSLKRPLSKTEGVPKKIVGKVQVYWNRDPVGNRVGSYPIRYDLYLKGNFSRETGKKKPPFWGFSDWYEN